MVKMDIRKIKMEDANSYLEMLLNSELDKWARENNLTRLELTVVSSNIVAKHLYEKNGFKIEGTRKNAMIIDDKYADEYYMAKLYED